MLSSYSSYLFFYFSYYCRLKDLEEKPYTAEDALRGAGKGLPRAGYDVVFSDVIQGTATSSSTSPPQVQTETAEVNSSSVSP